MKHLPFFHQISGASIQWLLDTLRTANAPDCVHLSSPGGRFEFFSSLAPAIERRGIVMLGGNVRSAAVVLFLLGRLRYAFEDSTFFFHEVRTLIEPAGTVTIATLEEVLEYQEEMAGEEHELFQEWLRQMQAAQNWFIEFLSRKTQLPGPFFLDLMRSNATLSAMEARHYGIVHEIIAHDVLVRP